MTYKIKVLYYKQVEQSTCIYLLLINREKNMNIYQKINEVKKFILESKLKKTGKNGHINFSYYELGDIIPAIVDGCNKFKICCLFSMTDEVMTLKIVDIDKPTDTVEFTSPTRNWENKGCTPIQILGGTQTYLRRYLYLMAFDIVEPDFFDAIQTNQPQEIIIPDITDIATQMEQAISLKQLQFIIAKNKKYFTKQEDKDLLNKVYLRKKQELENK